MASGFAIIIIKEVLKALFGFLITIEKNHSKSDDTISLFWKSTIMQFVNMAIIQLILGFHIDGFENFQFMGFIPVFQGKYKDFSAQWYQEVGATLGVTLFFNIFGSHTKYIKKFV